MSDGAGWRPDPWQPGGWRWHDGTEWTSWTGPPPGPPGATPAAAVLPPTYTAAPWAARSAAQELASERRFQPWATIAVLLLAVAQALGPLVVAGAMRDLFGDVFDLAFDQDATTAEIEAAVDEARARQGDYTWLNLVGWIPLGLLAVVAAWSYRVATVARRLGYPARRSPAWAAAGWFVPIVNLWFPYQAVVDSLRPGHPRRARVLAWWLLWSGGTLVSLASFAVVLFSDETPPMAVVLPVVVVIAEAVLAVQVVSLVHDDHADALGGAGGPRG